MAVKPATLALHWSGSTGSVQREPLGAEYTAVYRVQTDDALDQAQTVLLWFQTAVVALGTPYAYAGDTAASVARADRIRASRDLKSTDWWQVVVSYATPQDEAGEDENGNATLDPLEFRPQVDGQTVQYSRPVQKARYIDGLLHDLILLEPNKSVLAPSNSAIQPYNPGPEMDDSRYTLRVTRNVLTVDANAFAENTVNLLPFDVDYKGLTKRFEKWTGKIREWQHQLRRQNGIDYWEVTCVIDYDRRTWLHELLDQGLHALARPGDPDGKGGTISFTDIIDGLPQLRRLTDKNGDPISDPVPFDGAGQPLTPPSADPFYGRWLAYPETDFKTITIQPAAGAFFKGIFRGVN